MQFVQPEQAHAEAAEIGSFVALQRHAGGGLQAGGEEFLAGLNLRVGGVADHHTRGLEAFGGHAGEAASFQQGAHAAAQFVLFGVLFKIGAWPFHSWVPDVYQGAPTPVTGFMAAGTKAAAFRAILRFVFGGVVRAAWVWRAGPGGTASAPAPIAGALSPAHISRSQSGTGGGVGGAYSAYGDRERARQTRARSIRTIP